LRAWQQYGVLVGLRVQLDYGLARTKDSPTSPPARLRSYGSFIPTRVGTPVSNWTELSGG